LRAVAKEIGVSHRTAKNWHRGSKRYRNGKIVGFTPPLGRLEVRPISAGFLSKDERILIGDMRREGLSLRKIAAELGRALSMVSREIQRIGVKARGYRPFDAHRKLSTGVFVDITAVFTMMSNCAGSSASSSLSVGVQGRAHDIFVRGFLTSPSGGSATRPFIRRSTSPALRWYAQCGWPRARRHRCDRGVRIVVRSIEPTSASRGLSSRCN
jgi:hypothetical protein